MSQEKTTKPEVNPIRSTVSTDEFLTVPGCEVLFQTPNEKSIRVEALVHILMRVAAVDPNCRVECWIKIKEH